MLFRVLLLCSMGLGQIGLAQNFSSESVLASGEIFRMAVSQDGIYKIDKAFLQKLGVPLSGKNLKNLRLYAGHHDLLPQENHLERIDDLRELPLYVSGLEDGSFDEGDYILFYGKGPDSWHFNPSSKKFEYAKHWYSRKNYYFLKFGATAGSMIRKAPVPSAGSSTAEVTTYTKLFHYEQDLQNLVGSGREWVGEELKDQKALELAIMTRGWAPAASGLLTVSVVSAVPERSAFTIKVAGRELGQIGVEAAQSTVYGHKGREKSAEFILPPELIRGENLVLELSHRHNSHESGYLNTVNLQLPVKLNYPGHPLLFRCPEGLKNPVSRYILQGASQNLMVWELTDPFAPRMVESSLSGTNLSFLFDSKELKEFVAFDPATLDMPEAVGRIENQNLHSLSTPELLIITHNHFKEAAEKLASFRRTNDGLSTAVVSPEQVYNEFSSGKQDVSALRDFIRMLYLRNNRLRYVLLFGDASYDYLSDLPENTNRVPVYQSKTSFHNIHSYASDDFYGFLELHEGSWEEEGNLGNHSLDVAIGRLPVQTKEEAADMVNKLIRYVERSAMGDWRLRTLFVADDGDANKHQHQSNYLASLSEEAAPVFTANRLFTDAYPKVRDRFGLGSPAMRNELQKQIEHGALVVDYIGHGSETVWTNERILDLAHIEAWENPDHMPVVLTATCAFGRFDDPKRVSGAEKMLLKPTGGAIGLLTSTRPVFPNTSFEFSQAFYQAAFKEELLYTGTLGDMFLQAKNRSIAGTTNRNFSLLGDPSMRLAVPKKKIVLEKINGSPVQGHEKDSLPPLQKVRLQGSVQQKGIVDEHFEGDLQITVWGDYSDKTTLGNEGENTIFSYQNRENILYKGMASLKRGRYDVEILVPAIKDPEKRNCKIVLYGIHNSLTQDAAGYQPLILGGKAEGVAPDTHAPSIKLWLENRDFEEGETVSNRPLLIAELADESGVLLLNNLTDGIKLVVDGQEDSAMVISSYYRANQDTYQSGVIKYRLGMLEEGEHRLSLAASDIWGNRREVHIRFVVDGQNIFSSKPASIYPNPSRGEVNIKVHLNQPEASPEFQLYLYSTDGKLVMEEGGGLKPDNEGFSIIKFDLEQSHHPQGLYFFKLLLKFKEKTTMEQKTGRFTFYR